MDSLLIAIRDVLAPHTVSGPHDRSKVMMHGADDDQEAILSDRPDRAGERVKHIRQILILNLQYVNDLCSNINKLPVYEANKTN